MSIKNSLVHQMKSTIQQRTVKTSQQSTRIVAKFCAGIKQW